MSSVHWKQWKKFSGPMIRGNVPLPTPPVFGESIWDHVHQAEGGVYHGPHWDRVSYLTAMVESGGKFGTCVMFDGTGITAGIHQAVAVYPKNLKAQGPLWELLWRMDSVMPLPYYPIWSAIDALGWQLSPRGLIWKHSGRPVQGRHIRSVLTPVDGVVPAKGEHFLGAKSWLLAFNEVFLMSSSHRLQVMHGIERFIHHAEHYSLGKSNGEVVTIEDKIYNGVAEERDPFGGFGAQEPCPELDLAMALFWCNWVNAPAVANRIMKKRYKKIARNPVDGAVLLVHDLGTAKYGRWDDDIGRGEGRKYKSRYQRFRGEAMKLYPEELFRPGMIMADDLPG